MEKMIKVTIGNNLKRYPAVIVSNTRTLRSVLEEQEFDYSRGFMTLDGSSLNPGDLDKTFESFGIIDSCYLLSVVKADNA